MTCNDFPPDKFDEILEEDYLNDMDGKTICFGKHIKEKVLAKFLAVKSNGATKPYSNIEEYMDILHNADGSSLSKEQREKYLEAFKYGGVYQFRDGLAVMVVQPIPID